MMANFGQNMYVIESISKALTYEFLGKQIQKFLRQKNFTVFDVTTKLLNNGIMIKNNWYLWRNCKNINIYCSENLVKTCIFH